MNAQREQLGVKCLAQGHFDTYCGLGKIPKFRLSDGFSTHSGTATALQQ